MAPPTRQSNPSPSSGAGVVASLSPEHEEVFLTMQLRKMQRDLNGASKRNTRVSYVALFCMLLLIYGASAGNTSDGRPALVTITLSFVQLIIIGVWVLLSVVVASAFSHSQFIILLRWMVVYWPLLAILTTMLFNWTSGFIWILFVAAEVATLVAFVGKYYFYPWAVQMKWFRGKWWKVRLVSDWTMTYKRDGGLFDGRHTCKYEGETNERGMPDGRGCWVDDSYDGEVLNGTWEDGVPVSPFLSRQYGTGDVFSAVRIAYFMATDDKFDSNKLYPTNNEPARCGVVNVECSIAGAFYNHLPVASELFGPHVVGEGASVAECCDRLVRLGTEEDHQASVEVKANNPMGVQVVDHVYEPTGNRYSKTLEQVVIDISRERCCHDHAPADTEDSMRESGPTPESHGTPAGGARKKEDAETEPEHASENKSVVAGETQLNDISEHSSIGQGTKFARLRVQNWNYSPRKEALVYFPGFNSNLKHSLETLGQFMAMSQLSERVYPICFAWPGGQVPTYLNASEAAATSRNRDNLRQLLRGLSSAGFRYVHFLSHSLGVQTLVGAFEDKDDGSRSDVSLCFQLDPAFDEGAPGDDDEGMVCKSLTMLNPDFPVEAFVDRAFLSIRRVCSHITIVGDRCDQALFWSQVINGTMRWLGYEHPKVLCADTEEEKKRGLQYKRVIGRDIELLYVPNEKRSMHDEECPLREGCDDRLLFKGVPSVALRPDERLIRQQWLDLDVIDTTSLDTNIQNLRHSAFNINPILLNDLEELILTGRRAKDRSTLLYRDGNVFRYCHAPSFVAM